MIDIGLIMVVKTTKTVYIASTSKYKKIVNFKKENRDPEKNYLNKVKIVRVCDFIIFEIPILTVWSATYM